jgi:CrcB protein
VADRLEARRLSFELKELLLVGLGAVPGALLRWQSKLIQAGRPAWGLLLIAVSLMLGLLCVAAGLALSRSLFSSPQD